MNGTGEYKALNFVLDDGVYGAGVPDVGDNYGYAAAAYAIFGFQQFEWLDGPEGVSHKLQAALNSFYGKSLEWLILAVHADRDRTQRAMIPSTESITTSSNGAPKA